MACLLDLREKIKISSRVERWTYRPEAFIKAFVVVRYIGFCGVCTNVMKSVTNWVYQNKTSVFLSGVWEKDLK